MPTVDQIRATDPEALVSTANSLTTKNRVFSSTLDQMRSNVDYTMSSWKGGRKFASDPGPSGPWYQLGYGTSAHSHYFDINNNTPVRSLQNVGDLITNQPNKVD